MSSNDSNSALLPSSAIANGPLASNGVDILHADANEHLPDSSGFAFTPTLRTGPTTTTEPANNALPAKFSVCIIGGSRGIGAAIALSYAQAGAATLILTATTTAGLSGITAQIKAVNPATAVVPVACDVSRAADVARLAATICEDVPAARLDAVVVNAAHYGELVVDVAEGDPAEFQRCMDVNATGAYLAAHYLLPLLVGTEGGAKTFLAVSSLAAWLTGGLIAHLAVCVSKLAQVRVVEHVAEQYGGKGVVAVSVHPGCVKTDMAKAAPKEFEKYLIDEPGLCGAMCVWITRNRLAWLNGRFVSATWDADELLERKEAIIKKDMLKARMIVS